MNYEGVIIEESLDNKDVLKLVKILKTKIEMVTPRMNTPHLKQWTLHTVEIPEEKADEIAQEISRSLKLKEEWYADYRNNQYHFIIFREKIFKVNRRSSFEYEKVKEYGISLGIPAHQVNFTEDVVR
jgi:hypothetical protein